MYSMAGRDQVFSNLVSEATDVFRGKRWHEPQIFEPEDLSSSQVEHKLVIF